MLSQVSTANDICISLAAPRTQGEWGGVVLPPSGKWQVAAPVVATLLPCCCLAAGLAPVATRQLRLTFVLVFLPLCASHLAVRCVSCAKRSEQRDREREREIEKILKYATKARWNFKLSRGLLIRPSGAERDAASTFSALTSADYQTQHSAGQEVASKNCQVACK